MTKNGASITLLALFALFAVAVLLLLGYLAVAVWPQSLLNNSGLDLDSLSGSEHIAALSDARTSLLAMIGGASAGAIAAAAIWQANAARSVHLHGRSIDWSNSFSSASKMLVDANPVVQLSGVVALRGLYGAGPERSGEFINRTLAQFVRSQATGDALLLALHTVVQAKRTGPLSIAGSDLSGLDLAGFPLEGLDLAGVSFRDTTLDASQKVWVESFKGVDTSGVKWR